MIKVLYFLNSVVRGGVEEHVLGILQGIDRSRFDPILVCPQELLDKVDAEIRELEIRHYAVKIRKWTDMDDIKKFKRILLDELPDVVHTHLFYATLFAAPIAKGAKVPVVIETAHIREAWRKGLKAMYWIDRFYYRYVDRVIAVSHAVKQYLVEKKKLKPGKIEVIHNGVDLSKFSGSVIARSGATKQSFGIDTNPSPPPCGEGQGGGSALSGTVLISKHNLPLPQGEGRGEGGRKQSLICNPATLQPCNPVKFAVIGRLEEQKGHKYFLEAIGMMDKKLRKQAEFLIVGDGVLREELEAQARDLNINSNVQFLGYRSDVAMLMEDYDCIVLPSLFEGLPLVLLEAGAMAKAVIATAVDGSPEAVEEGKTGFIVPDRDPQALKAAMEKMINNRDLLAEFGQNGRKRVQEQFDIIGQVRKTESLYEALLAAQQPCNQATLHKE